jgi:predicted nucleic acid-binding protein
MRTVFADTFYFLALWNPQDNAHARAMAFTQGYHETMVTTDWVVTELADALCQGPNRAMFARLFGFFSDRRS